MILAMALAMTGSPPPAGAAIQGEAERYEVAQFAAMQAVPFHVQLRVDAIEREPGGQSFRSPCRIAGTVTTSFRGSLKAGQRITLDETCLDFSRGMPVGGIIVGFDLARLSVPGRHLEAYLEADGTGRHMVAAAAGWLLDAPSDQPRHPAPAIHALTNAQLAGLFTHGGGSSLVGERQGRIWKESYARGGRLAGEEDGVAYAGFWKIADGRLCTSRTGQPGERCGALVLERGLFTLAGESRPPMLVQVVGGDVFDQGRRVAGAPLGVVRGTVLRTLSRGFVLARPGEPGLTFVSARPPLPAEGRHVEVTGGPVQGVWAASGIRHLAAGEE